MGFHGGMMSMVGLLFAFAAGMVVGKREAAEVENKPN
jgi:hypothetical protein